MFKLKYSGVILIYTSLLSPIFVYFCNVILSHLPSSPQQTRLEKMADFQQRGEDLENNSAECQRLVKEAQKQLKKLEMMERDDDEAREAELKRVQDDEKCFEKLKEEHRREEGKLPWNVDTLSKDGFIKVNDGIGIRKFGLTCPFPNSSVFLVF